jgi:hypothetical protein
MPIARGGRIRLLLCTALAGLMLVAGTLPAFAAESVDDNDGSTPATPTAADLPAGSKCYTSGSTNTSGDNWFYLQLNNRRNVHVLLATCVRYTSGNACATVYQGWWPGGDSDRLDLSRFDHFRVNVQLQRNNTTVYQATLTDEVFRTYINAETSRSWWNGPSLTVCSPWTSSASWTADGWVQWDKNDDGKGWLDVHYLHGSPVL